MAANHLKDAISSDASEDNLEKVLSHVETIGAPSAARCQCAGCLLADCRDCRVCQDMVCFGGKGRLDEKCIRKVCRGIVFKPVNNFVKISKTFKRNLGISDELKKMIESSGAEDANSVAASLLKKKETSTISLIDSEPRSKRSPVSRTGYSPEFKRHVVEFGLSNRKSVASRKFNVPMSTVCEWVAKALKTRDGEFEADIVESTLFTDDCSTKPKESMMNMKQISVTSEDEKGLIVDLGCISADGNLTEIKNTKSSPVSIKYSRIDEETKLEIVAYGVEQKSWRVAAAKFDKPISSVAYWGRRAGYRFGKRRKLLEGVEQLREVTSATEAVQDKGYLNTQTNITTVTVDKSAEVSTGPMTIYQPITAPACTPGMILTKCKACDYYLATDETLNEHLVSAHLTVECLCNICGGESEDFFDHFKIHLENYQEKVVSPPMVTVKAELLEKADWNQNCVDMNKTIGVEVTVRNSVRNPFFSSS